MSVGVVPPLDLQSKARRRKLSEISLNIEKMDELPGEGESGRLSSKRPRSACEAEGWSSSCQHYGDGAGAMRRNGPSSGCRSPHGTKRTATEDEIDRICDVTIKRLRLHEVPDEREHTEEGMEDEPERKDIDYSESNQRLKEAHLQYLQQRQRLGLPPLTPQDCSNSDSEDSDEDDC